MLEQQEDVDIPKVQLHGMTSIHDPCVPSLILQNYSQITLINLNRIWNFGNVDIHKVIAA